MNCPVCNRDNTFNLSICPSCGAMMNDSVRAELLSKISISKPLKRMDGAQVKENSAASGALNPPPAPVVEKTSRPLPAAPTASENAPVVFEKTVTSDIAVKATSPTLVEFHSKNSSVPEWRLQLQNVVRKRNDRENQPVAAAQPPVKTAPVRQTKLSTSGANALKIDAAQLQKPSRAKNPTLSSALARIEKSRQKFLVEEDQPIEPSVTAPRPANKNFPFYIAPKQSETETTANETPAPVNFADKPKIPNAFAEKPKLAAPLKIDSGDLNTNKLPPLPQVLSAPVAAAPKDFASRIIETVPPTEVKNLRKNEAPVELVASEKNFVEAETFEEFEDSAPLSLRFNAGLFDLIIGGFAGLLLLAPFMMTDGDWFTFTGLLAFLATCSIVMFVYLTTTIGFYGRTFGMRIFSLEVVDADGENYPTLHQSAVSSAVYILSLVFGGAGFLTMLFNPEKRAAHDLISGTIVVKEN